MTMPSKALAADTYPAECCRAKKVKSINELAELTSVTSSILIGLLHCRKEVVFLEGGDYSAAASRLSVFIGLTEDMLFGEHPEAEARRVEAEQTFAASFGPRAAPDPLDSAIQSNLKDSTTRVLSSLTPREEKVLRQRFGIGTNSDHTIDEAGRLFSVHSERIRQIEAKALRKLKHPNHSRKLRSFLDGPENTSPQQDT